MMMKQGEGLERKRKHLYHDLPHTMAGNGGQKSAVVPHIVQRQYWVLLSPDYAHLVGCSWKE